MIFTPQALVPFTQDNKTIHVYPKLQDIEDEIERTFGWYATINSINDSIQTDRFKYTTLGSITGTTSDIATYLKFFESHAKSKIKTVQKLAVISYHGSNGLVIPEALNATGELRNFANLPAATRRPANIHFAKLRCAVHFNDITDIFVENRTVYNFTFFVKLNVESRTVRVPGNARDVTYSTFFGPPDWVSANDQGVYNDCVTINSINLNPFTFLSTTNQIQDTNNAIELDYDSKKKELFKIVQKAAWSFIMSHVRDKICPTVQHDPTTMLQSIAMESIDNVTKSVTKYNIKEYYHAIKTATQLFSSSRPFPINAVHHFYNHLSPALKAEYLKQPNQYSPSIRNATAPVKQATDLMTAFQLTQKLETNLSDQADLMKGVAKEEFAQVKGFSVYEKSYDKYNQSKPSDTSSEHKPYVRPERKCCACDSTDHLYKKTFKGEIICPVAKSNPEARARGEREYKAILARVKENRDRKAFNKDRVKNKRATALAYLISHPADDEYQIIKKQKSDDSDVIAFPALIFSATHKQVIPVPIEHELPHIRLNVGKPQTTPKVSFMAAIDTCAQCSVGKTQFHLPLIKAFPFLVRSVTRADNNELMPIQLQGIVQPASKEDQKSMKMAEDNHSTSLNILVEYYLPLTNSDPTSLNKCFTFKVALGSGVAINTILGLPFLKQSKCMIDLNDGVVQSKSFSDPPFKIEYQLPDSSPPPDFEAIKKASTQSTSKVDINLVKAIDSLHDAFVASSNIIPSTDESTNHSTYNPL